MKKIFSIFIIFFLFTNSNFAADEIEKGKTLLKSLSKKSLTKKETITFLSEYAVILEDERGDGKVTYIFDDEKYSRYKDSEIISTDAWRLCNTLFVPTKFKKASFYSPFFLLIQK